MQIPLSSNIVTAIYVVLSDLILPLVVSLIVSQFLSSWNARRIHKDRKLVQLTETRLSIFTHQGLTEKPIGQITAAVATVIVSLALIGGFSLSGVSRKGTTFVKVPFLVDFTTSENTTDYTQHVSEDGQLASGTYRAVISSVICKSTGTGISVHYAAMHSLRDVTTVEWPAQMHIRNHTCCMEEHGFVDRVTMRYKTVRDAHSACRYNINVTSPQRLTKAEANATGSCKMIVREAWCGFYRYPSCAISVESKDGFGFVLVTPRTTGNQTYLGEGSPTKYFAEKAPPSQSVRSLAYLWSTGVYEESWGPFSWPRVGHLVMLGVSSNVDVEKLLGRDVSETEVDVVFLSCTFGTALFMTLLLGVGAYIRWWKTFSSPEMKDCNCFYSGKDMLRSVMYEAFGHERGYDGKKGMLKIGVSRKVPHVGPMEESDESGGHMFPEAELEGRASKKNV